MSGERGGWLLLMSTLVLPAALFVCWRKSLSAESVPRSELLSAEPAPIRIAPPPSAPLSAPLSAPAAAAVSRVQPSAVSPPSAPAATAVSRDVPSVVSPVVGESVPQPEPTRDALAPEPLEFNPQVDRDPTVSERERLSLIKPPPVEPPARPSPARRAPRAPKLTVQAIMGVDGGALMAIVNDRSVKAGDVVSGARIARIRLDRVEFVHQGRRIVKEFR